MIVVIQKIDYSVYSVKNRRLLREIWLQYFADYLRNIALEDDKNNVAKVWVFVTHEKEVIGYVTLIMSQLSENKRISNLGS